MVGLVWFVFHCYVSLSLLDFDLGLVSRHSWCSYFKLNSVHMDKNFQRLWVIIFTQRRFGVLLWTVNIREDCLNPVIFPNDSCLGLSLGEGRSIQNATTLWGFPFHTLNWKPKFYQGPKPLFFSAPILSSQSWEYQKWTLTSYFSNIHFLLASKIRDQKMPWGSKWCWTSGFLLQVALPPPPHSWIYHLLVFIYSPWETSGSSYPPIVIIFPAWWYLRMSDASRGKVMAHF